jgi:hypothetical protein
MGFVKRSPDCFNLPRKRALNTSPVAVSTTYQLPVDFKTLASNAILLLFRFQEIETVMNILP